MKCNGALSIDNFNQTTNEWIAKVSIDSKIAEIKSTCRFIDPKSNTHSMFDYEFLMFNMTTFKMAETGPYAKFAKIETKASGFGMVGIAVGIVIFSGFILIGYRHRYVFYSHFTIFSDRSYFIGRVASAKKNEHETPPIWGHSGPI